VVTAEGAAHVRVTKRHTVSGGRRDPHLTLTVDLENTGHLAIRSRFGVEWTLTMLGGGANPAAWWDVAGTRTTHDVAGEAASVDHLTQGNDYTGITVTTQVSTQAEAWWAPVETISNSEAGFERVYQGSGLLLSWPLDLAAGDSARFTVSHDVSTTVDRADAQG
jgi:alpha-amylase